MPKRKNAFTTPPPQAPTIDDKLKQGIGSLALEWIAKKPRQDLEAYTFNNLMEHGKTVLQKLKLTDQIKEQKKKQRANIDARVKGQRETFRACQKRRKNRPWQFNQKGYQKPHLKEATNSRTNKAVPRTVQGHTRFNIERLVEQIE